MPILLYTSFTTRLDLLYLIFACVGIVIILACIGTYLFSYGAILRDKVQEIKIFGADMKISVITVCMLVGVALIAPLVWTSFNYTLNAFDNTKRTLEAEKNDLIQERNNYRTMYEQALAKNTREQPYLLSLEGTDGKDFPKKEDLEVVFTPFNSISPQVIEHEITPGLKKKIKVIFKNITDETVYPTVEVIHKRTRQRWMAEEFRPCMPSLNLKLTNE